MDGVVLVFTRIRIEGISSVQKDYSIMTGGTNNLSNITLINSIICSWSSEHHDLVQPVQNILTNRLINNTVFTRLYPYNMYKTFS